MNVEKLREELFATLSALRDKENPMDIERAKAVVLVADAITSTAKVEVEMVKHTGASGTGFIPQMQTNGPQRPRLVDPTAPGTPIGKGK
jgi:hypothetical protein